MLLGRNVCRLSLNPARGFTLVEIMLVVIIIGILAAMVVANMGGMSGQAKITRAQADLGTIRQQIKLYEQKHDHYPTEEEGGLMALVERPSRIPEGEWKRFLDNDPIDPWGNPYMYLVGSRRIDTTREFNLYSWGPNQVDNAMQEDDIK